MFFDFFLFTATIFDKTAFWGTLKYLNPGFEAPLEFIFDKFRKEYKQMLRKSYFWRYSYVNLTDLNKTLLAKLGNSFIFRQLGV